MNWYSLKKLSQPDGVEVSVLISLQMIFVEGIVSSWKAGFWAQSNINFRSKFLAFKALTLSGNFI